MIKNDNVSSARHSKQTSHYHLCVNSFELLNNASRSSGSRSTPAARIPWQKRKKSKCANYDEMIFHWSESLCFHFILLRCHDPPTAVSHASLLTLELIHFQNSSSFYSQWLITRIKFCPNPRARHFKVLRTMARGKKCCKKKRDGRKKSQLLAWCDYLSGMKGYFCMPAVYGCVPDSALMLINESIVVISLGIVYVMMKKINISFASLVMSNGMKVSNLVLVV